jgi:hypothetical protein
MLAGEYNTYKRWHEGKCFHTSEVYALTERAKELQQLGVGRAAGLTALQNSGLKTRCSALRSAMGDSNECPLKHELDQLAAFVSDPKNIAVLDKYTIEFGRGRRPVALTPQQEALAQVVDVAAQDAYFTYARMCGIAPKDMRQKAGSCFQTQFILQQRLRGLGIETQARRHQRGAFGHFFLRLDTPDGPMDVDPTWQQFVPTDNNYDSLPHTLIVPTSQTAEVVTSFGVPPNWTNVWEKSREGTTPWWHFTDPDIHDFVEAEGYLEAPTPMPNHISDMLEAGGQPGGEDAILRAIQQAIDTMRVSQ